MTDQPSNLDLHINELNAMLLDPRWKDQHMLIKYRVKTLTMLQGSSAQDSLTPELVKEMRSAFTENNSEATRRRTLRQEVRSRGWQFQSHECYFMLIFANEVVKLAIYMSSVVRPNKAHEVEQVDGVRRFAAQLHHAAVCGYTDRLLLSFDHVVGKSLVMFDDTKAVQDLYHAFQFVNDLVDFDLHEWAGDAFKRRTDDHVA